MKIAVLTSGGVDSSVALRFLRDQGHDVTAFYLKIWLEDELQYLGNCPWEEDLEVVQKICSTIDVPLQIVPMQKEYRDTIVQYVIDESKAGRTPNPDVLCNQFVKFGLFYNKIDSLFEKIATGHYARIDEDDGKFLLRKAPDPIKDQTYFLARLSQQQLARALFPIGHLKKAEVRQFAEDYDLPNKNRKDSQGICFLGKFKYRDFLRYHLGEQPGNFVSQKTGEVVGRHIGYYHYTIGQRNGLDLNGGPWFVVDKDIEKNQVVVAHGYKPEAVYQTAFEVGELRWIANPPFATALNVKIRHGETSYPCTLFINDDSGRVILKKPIHGVAAGQFAVFYNGDICLGGGVIT